MSPPFLKRVIFYFFAISFLVLTPQNTSLAARATEFESGLDQTFSAGYSQQSFADSFHSTAFEEPAAEEDKAGWDHWTFYKGFNFSTTYDSNIFLAHADEVEDGILTYTPTIGISRGGRYDYFQTFYDLSYVEYIDNGKLSRFNHSLTTRMGYRFPKLKVDIYNNLKPDTAYSTGERTELRSAETSRVITYSDHLLARADYELTEKTRLSYTHRYILYYFPSSSNSISTNNFSSQTHIFSPRISYRISQKTDIYAQYDLETADFFEGGLYGSRSHVASAGISGKLAPKTSVNFGLGYRWRDYGNQTAAQNEEDFQWKAAISQRITNKISATLWAARDLQEDLANISSTLSANRLVHFYGLNMTWQATRHIDLQTGMSVGYDEKEGLVTITDPDNSRLTLTRQLEDNFYEGNISLNWNPRSFVAVLVGYKYFKKESSFKNFEYDDHKAVASIRLKF